MNTIKTSWLTVLLIVVTLAGAACGVQPTSEEFETVEVQEAVAKSDQTATGEAPTANLLLWQGPALFEKDQSVCHQFIITADNQALIGLCPDEAQPAALLGTHSQTWSDLVARFAPFETEIDKQRLLFNGRGEIEGAAWERAIAAWGSLTYAELASGRVSATGPTALAWTIGPLPDEPDTCQQLVVLVYGYAMAGTTPCAGGSTTDFSDGWIETAKWEQFDAWLYGYGPLYQDNNYLDGRGTAEMSAAEVEALSAWAAAVYEEISETAAVKPDQASGSDEDEKAASVEPVVPDEPALFPISDEQGRWGFIDHSGQVVVEPQYDYVERYSEGRAAVQQNNKFGFLDENGQVVVEPQYEAVFAFSEGRAAVLDGVKWGLIDRDGRLIVEPQYDSIVPFQEGLARVETFGQWGVIDTTGRMVIDPQFEMVGYFNEGRANIYENGKFGFIDRQGQIIVAPQYDGANEFSAGLAAVLRGDQWGYIDLAGREVIPSQFDGAWNFVDGLARVAVGRQWGLIDLTGKVVIEPQYGLWQSAPGSQAAFSEGLAAVQIGDTFGFIDPTGQVVIEPQFVGAEGFWNGLARVEVEAGYGYIDRRGHFVWGPMPLSW